MKHQKAYYEKVHFEREIFIVAKWQALMTPHNLYISFLNMVSIMTFDLINQVLLKVKHLKNVKFSAFIFFKIAKLIGIDSAFANVLPRNILTKF